MLQETRQHKSKSATRFCPVSLSLCTTRCDPTQLLGLRTESELVVVFVGLARRSGVYRVSQEEWTKLRESVPYVKLYLYNPKHLYPKLNGYGDNGQRSLKLWQLLHTYWLPNTYWNWLEYVVSVMLIFVLNIKVTCEWHKAIKLNYKNTRTTVVIVLRFPSKIYTGRSCSLSRQGHCIPMLASGFSLSGMRSGWVWRHGPLTVRGHPRSPHFSIAIISVTVQLWI